MGAYTFAGDLNLLAGSFADNGGSLEDAELLASRVLQSGLYISMADEFEGDLETLVIRLGWGRNSGHKASKGSNSSKELHFE